MGKRERETGMDVRFGSLGCSVSVRQKMIALLLMLGIPLGLATSQIMVPSDSLHLFVDFARFRGDSSNTYVELYYSFSQRSLTYREDSTGFHAGVDLTLLVRRGDSVVYADRWLVPHLRKSFEESADEMNLVAISALQLPEGQYRATILGHDFNNSARTDTVVVSIPIRVVDTTRVVLSDLELASSIAQSEGGGPFYKNTLEVIPNPRRIFGASQVCFVYAEAYNLLGGEIQGAYSIRTSVRDGAGREIITRERQRRRAAESSIVIDQIAVGQLRTGSYNLGISLLDSTKVVLTSSANKFFVYNPQLGVDTSLASGIAPGSTNLYSGMSEEELDREFSWVRYDATEEEKRQYEAITGAASKSGFLLEFWRRRPLGLREEYLRRVAYANANYRVMGREGYRTDRGRVHIVYGPPDDLERHPNEPETRPYEIWSYNSIQGGVVFVFVQRISSGEYELVHSTHRNELRDDLWRQRYAETVH